MYEQNIVGMQSVATPPTRFINAGLVGSQAVYPRASNVERRPPDGKLEASGSPSIKFFPENVAIALPSGVGSKKESCFSALEPVNGKNQCV